MMASAHCDWSKYAFARLKCSSAPSLGRQPLTAPAIRRTVHKRRNWNVAIRRHKVKARARLAGTAGLESIQATNRKQLTLAETPQTSPVSLRKAPMPKTLVSASAGGPLCRIASGHLAVGHLSPLQLTLQCRHSDLEAKVRVSKRALKLHSCQQFLATAERLAA
jgi:hypothetical protein